MRESRNPRKAILQGSVFGDPLKLELVKEVCFHLSISNPPVLLHGEKIFTREGMNSTFIGGNITRTMDGSYDAASLFAQDSLN